jgi:hypothetical protein
MIVMKQFNNNIAKKIMPFISELNSEDSAKNDTNINGANRNPIYNKDCIFNISTMIVCVYTNNQIF